MESGATPRDLTVALTRGVLGALPIIGPLAAEVVGAIIPNQRLDRIESLLSTLERRVQPIDPQAVAARFRDLEFVDVLEDGMQQAARAVEPERIGHIAALLKNSIAEEELQRLRDKRLLAILSELNSVKILILTSYTRDIA